MEEKIKNCGTCDFFNGRAGDGVQFCDELETHTSETWCCNRHRERRECCATCFSGELIKDADEGYMVRCGIDGTDHATDYVCDLIS